MEKVNKGKFIVFEGIDGCGKSTQFSLLAKHIFSKSKYNHVFLTREPYKLREIREILKKDDSPYNEGEKLAHLFVKDREHHINEVINPTVNKGDIVVSDRYKHSTIVYQSTQGLQIQKLVDMHKDMPRPDVTFIIDLPAKIAKERMGSEGRDVEQKFEKSVDFQESLRKAYLKIPNILEGEKIFIIDGNRSVEDIRKEIASVYDKEIDVE